uniref:Uncharacterized protein n=1 Tax=Rhizophora mucronata TaxID=61149 RepID=A0A2P2P6B5_RHIMU
MQSMKACSSHGHNLFSCFMQHAMNLCTDCPSASVSQLISTRIMSYKANIQRIKFKPKSNLLVLGKA